MKKTTVAPWSETETRHLNELLKTYPEYADRTICNQFKYYCPHQQHSEKAIRSKINTLRPNKVKSKWNAIAHTRLAQMVANKNTYEDMAAEFNTSVAAITHQIHRIKNLGLIDKTPGRQVNLHSRVTTSVVKPALNTSEDVKQLKINYNQEDAVAEHNKLSAQIRTIDKSVERLIVNTRPRTATEMRINHGQAEQKWQATQQEILLNGIVHVADHIAQLMSNTLQLLKEEKCNYTY